MYDTLHWFALGKNENEQEVEAELNSIRRKEYIVASLDLICVCIVVLYN